MSSTLTPSAQPSASAGRVPSRLVALGVTALLGLVITAAGLGLFEASASAFRVQQAAELDALTGLKVDEVVRWRKEEIAAAEALSSQAAYTMLRMRLHPEEAGPAEEQAKAWLRGTERLGDVTGIGIVDATGQFRVVVGEEVGKGHRPEELKAGLKRAEDAQEPAIFDLQDDETGLHLDVLAPVRFAGQVAGGVFVRVDPRRRLFPMVQDWPVPSRSVETLLLRADGDGALVLNQLRHDAAPPLSRRIAPGDLGADAALAAIRGQERSGPARDYRGVASLVATRGVPNSPWALLVKVDASEAFGPLWERLAWALSAAVAATLAAAMGVALWWRSRREAARRERDALARRVDFLSRWANDMVFLVSEDLRIVEANERASEVLGYTRDELLSMRLDQLRDPSTVGDLGSHFAVQAQQGWGHWETRYRRKDGSLLAVEVAVHVEYVGGKPWSHGVARDISARKRAEEALRTSEARFRAAFDGVTMGMVLLDQHGTIVESNRAMQAMLDRDGVALRGKSPLEFVHPEDAPAAMSALDILQVGSAPQADFGCRQLRRDGSTVETQVRICVLGGPEDRPEYALAVVEDVSDRRRLEAQLRLADRMASMGTLAAGMAHEINNPLAFVLANLEFSIRELRRDGTNQDVVAALEEAREGGTRVREIVRDLKTFSRADDAAREPLDVGRVLKSALSLAGSEIRTRARLEVSMTPTPRVLGSEHRLGQVLLNLLINAAQAIPEGSREAHTIRASTGLAPDGRVQVEISDDGAGIPPAIRARIFDPFFTTKPVGVGTGLGLSICHGIVVAMGGEITLESEEGTGSTFRVLLPAAPVEEPVRAPEAPRGAVRRAQLLVVDDEPLVCRALQRILSPPHDVRVQGSGQGALAALQAEDGWDLVLCDLMMPDLSGMDLHALVTAQRPELAARFVFLTGGAFTDSAREFLQRVPNKRVEKPFEPAALRELVARMLEAGKNDP